MSTFRLFWLKIYKKTRLPVVPIFGGYPVKLTTYIGRPIEIQHLDTPEKVKDTVMTELNDLIRAHQRIPGSITKALRERWCHG